MPWLCVVHTHNSSGFSREKMLALLLLHITVIEFAVLYIIYTIKFFRGVLGSGALSSVFKLPFALFALNVQSVLGITMTVLPIFIGAASYHAYRQYDLKDIHYFVIWTVLLIMYIFANIILFLAVRGHVSANTLIIPKVPF